MMSTQNRSLVLEFPADPLHRVLSARPRRWATTGLLSVGTWDIAYSIRLIMRRRSASPTMHPSVKSPTSDVNRATQSPHVTVCLAPLFHQATVHLRLDVESARGVHRPDWHVS